MRLIDADAFKAYMRSALEQTRRCYPDGGEWAEAVTEEFCRDIDEQPSAQPEQRWIPCSERLPEKNCRCLTTNEAWGSFKVDWNAWIDGQWLYPNEKPIAWMPLPEPYRGGDSE